MKAGVRDQGLGVREYFKGVAGASGDCSTCPHWKRKGSKKRGVSIPGGYGKCIRPQGHCDPEKPRLGIGGVRKEMQVGQL